MSKSRILVCAGILISSVNLFAQARAAELVGVGNFSHIVGNLERSIEFYGGVLGLEPNVLPTEFSPNPAIMRLGDTPGAQSRIATFSIPGTDLGVELIEYKDIARSPVQIRFQDPGAAVLQLRIRDMDDILSRLTGTAARIWTPSGEPVALQGTTRIVFLQDPDGFFVELIETPAEDGGGQNVFGASFELIISNSEESAAFYRAAFGAEPRMSESFDATPLLNDTVATHGGAFRRTGFTLPNTKLGIAFLEFRGITRRALDTRVQDPGTAILQVFVDDVPAMTDRLIRAGGTMVTSGGGPVDLGGGRLLAIVRDPNNLFIELIAGGG